MRKESLSTKAWSVWWKKFRAREGSSLVEVILASSLFAILLSALLGTVFYGEEAGVLSGARTRAHLLAEEGLEAVRNIRDQSFGNLIDGTFGLAVSSSRWITSGTEDVSDIYTRQIQIGTIDADTKHVTSTISWQQNLERQGQVVVSTRLTNWRKSQQGGRGGMLVYGNGGTTSDAVVYRLLDPATETWSTAANVADVDAGSTNRALRAMQMYASATRNEKVLVSRHYNGSTQYIYAQVWNGTSTSWGNVVLLSSWSATTFLDVQNFSGTYLVNGDFMVVYSDNTTTPKARVWDGSGWVSQFSLPNVGGIPNYIVARARPGTNEVMSVFFGQARDTNSAYFNGGAYITASWTLHTEHATNAPSNSRRHVDFAWSPNTSTTGALVYTTATNDKGINIKIWTANGAGGGSWSGTVNSPTQTNNVGSLSVIGRTGEDEFVACDKDVLTSGPDIVCYEANFTPTWLTPSNNILTTGTDTGIQRSFDASFESSTGATAIGVYSDTTAVPKLKKYTTTTNTWDASATSLNTLGGALESVQLITHPANDDVMILLGNTNQDLFSVVWDGANDAVYTTPAGKAFSSHGVSGSNDLEFWFDFVWDRHY